MRPAAEEWRVMHVLASGLRFLARRPLGRRAWRRLPTLEISDEDLGRVALMQAEAILTGKAPSPQRLR